jgi:hypothetical protein
MPSADRIALQGAWTLSGRYFGFWEGDDLWSWQGRHIGRLRGADIFAPDGRYIGEMMGNGRLAARSRKLGTYGNSYIAWSPRTTVMRLPSEDPGTQRPGFEDFPSPDEFQPPAVAALAFSSSIPC